MPYRHHRYVKRTIPFYHRGPGPAKYKLPPLLGPVHHDYTRHCYPAYTIANKLLIGPFYHPETIGPGPAYLIEDGQKASGAKGHIRWTIPGKTDAYPISDTPGPTKYYPPGPDVYRYKYPEWSIRYKHKLLKKSKHPSPMDHHMPPMLGPHVLTRTAAMECTFKGDRKDRDKKASPGPIYQVGEPNKKRYPAWEFGRKWKEFATGSGDLGPGSYDPDYDVVLPVPPRVDFGIRYNQFTGVLKTPCDNC